jgi:hypothetical protein
MYLFIFLNKLDYELCFFVSGVITKNLDEYQESRIIFFPILGSQGAYKDQHIKE